MAKESGRYTSIEEIRASFYPGSVGMVDLESGEILELPFTRKTRRIIEDIARQTPETEESEMEEGSSD